MDAPRVCKFHLRGNCHFGSRCDNRHISSSSGSPLRPPPGSVGRGGRYNYNESYRGARGRGGHDKGGIRRRNFHRAPQSIGEFYAQQSQEAQMERLERQYQANDPYSKRVQIQQRNGGNRKLYERNQNVRGRGDMNTTEATKSLVGSSKSSRMNDSDNTLDLSLNRSASSTSTIRSSSTVDSLHEQEDEEEEELYNDCRRRTRNPTKNSKSQKGPMQLLTKDHQTSDHSRASTTKENGNRTNDIVAGVSGLNVAEIKKLGELSESNSDLVFLMSLLPQMKQLSAQKNSEFRMHLFQHLHEKLHGGQNE